MGGFFSYLLGAIIKPRQTFDRLLNEPKSMLYGLIISLIMGILYTISIIGFFMTHKSSFIPPFLIIPADTYYFWEIFFAYPISFLNQIMATGVVVLMGLLFSRQQTFDKTFAVLSFAISIPVIPMWIVDTTLVVLFLTDVMRPQEWDWLITHVPFWQVFNVCYSLLVFIWQYIVMTITAHVTLKLKFWSSLLIGTVTVLTFWVIWAVFIR